MPGVPALGAVVTPLERLIRRQIDAAGPMTVADFMELCLGHPAHGVYGARDPLGARGDFVTAPEVSQLFGEMVGLWLAAVWGAAGRPGPVNLVELGPGRGTLMADVLRVTRGSGLAEAAEVWLVERSAPLRAEQARRIPTARWATDLETVPDGPMLLIANEFFDALPVRQYLASPEGWRERLIGAGPAGLHFGLSPPLPGTSPAEGWREISPAAERIAEAIAARLARAPGAALIIDYGYRAGDRPAGPTLQAVRRHAPADPLAAPGEADLSCLVDFDRLAAGFAGLPVFHAEQGRFLARLGIGLRAERLARAAPAAADAIADALERLTAPAQMGTLFKVLGVTAAGLAVPPGFEESA